MKKGYHTWYLRGFIKHHTWYLRGSLNKPDIAKVYKTPYLIFQRVLQALYLISQRVYQALYQVPCISEKHHTITDTSWNSLSIFTLFLRGFLKQYYMYLISQRVLQIINKLHHFHFSFFYTSNIFELYLFLSVHLDLIVKTFIKLCPALKTL